MLDVKTSIAWCKSHFKELLAGFGVFFAALAMWLSKSNRITNPGMALRVQKESKTIAKKEAMAEIYETQAEDKHEELAQLQTEIAESKKKVTAAFHGPIVEGMTDAEIADLYRKSGL